jgi:DNA-binding CsgD family transcriptional regulator
MRNRGTGETSARPAGLRAEWVEIDGERLLMFSHPLDTPHARPALPGLTAAEQAVVEQVVAGRTTAEIAAARGTSPRTVAKQLERIYQRLGVSSRAELCVRAVGPTPSS